MSPHANQPSNWPFQSANAKFFLALHWFDHSSDQLILIHHINFYQEFNQSIASYNIVIIYIYILSFVWAIGPFYAQEYSK